MAHLLTDYVIPSGFSHLSRAPTATPSTPFTFVPLRSFDKPNLHSLSPEV